MSRRLDVGRQPSRTRLLAVKQSGYDKQVERLKADEGGRRLSDRCLGLTLLLPHGYEGRRVLFFFGLRSVAALLARHGTGAQLSAAGAISSSLQRRRLPLANRRTQRGVRR